MKIYLKAVEPKVWLERCNECWFGREMQKSKAILQTCTDYGKNKFPCQCGEKHAGKIAVLATPQDIKRYEKRKLIKSAIKLEYKMKTCPICFCMNSYGNNFCSYCNFNFRKFR
jgi:hypothetical protein